MSVPTAAGGAADSESRAFTGMPIWNRLAIGFLAVSTLLRLMQLSGLELAPDEAYYWDWSRHLALGYYDQGPFIAYLIRATTSLFGTNEFGVRIGVLACSLGTILCAWALARRFFSPLAGFLTVLLLGVSPLMEVGSIIATYDPPLVFFWSLTVLFLERALFSNDSAAQNRAWIAAGIAAGLGFLSKHTMLLMMPCLVLFLAISPAHRFQLRRPWPYLAFGITLLLYSGVFWWNAQHHWWTFGHLLFLSHNANKHAAARRMGDYLAGQALLIGPVLFFGALIASGAAIKRFAQRTPITTAQAERHLFLAAMGAPVFILFLLVTLKSTVQGNWAVCAWITPAVLWSGTLAERIARRSIRDFTVTVVAAATAAFMTVVLVAPQLRFRLHITPPPDADLSNTAYGWREVAARVERVRTEMTRSGSQRVFIAANSYQYCALLAFYLPDRPETYDLFLHYRLSMYAAYVDHLTGRLGDDAVFINDKRADESDLQYEFESVAWDPPLLIYRRPYYTRPVRHVEIARCRGYRHYLGLTWARGG